MTTTTSPLPTSTCPTDSIPPSFTSSPPIPTDINYLTIPGSNASEAKAPWMVHCCAPYEVHVVDQCWLWCEADPGKVEGKNDTEIVHDFAVCLAEELMDLGPEMVVRYREGESGASSLGLEMGGSGLGLWKVVVVALGVVGVMGWLG